MSTTIAKRVFENNKLLKTVIVKVFANPEWAKNSPFFVNISYYEDDSENVRYPGIRLMTRRRAEGDLSTIVFYGFDDKKQVDREEDCSILNSQGVIYVQIPFVLSKQKEIIEKALCCGSLHKSVDDMVRKGEILRTLRLLRNHNLPNVVATVEPNLNALDNANEDTLETEWCITKDALAAARRNRIRKEIAVFKSLEVLLGPQQSEHYDSILRDLMKANVQYESIHRMFMSKRHAEIDRDLVAKKGRIMLEVLKKAIEAMGRMIDETSSRR